LEHQATVQELGFSRPPFSSVLFCVTYSSRECQVLPPTNLIVHLKEIYKKRERNKVILNLLEHQATMQELSFSRPPFQVFCVSYSLRKCQVLPTTNLIAHLKEIYIKKKKKKKRERQK